MDPSVIDIDEQIRRQNSPAGNSLFNFKSIIEQVKSDFLSFFTFIRNRSNNNPLLLLALLLTLPVSIWAVQGSLTYFSRAQSAGTVAVSFSPSSISLPPNKTVKMMFNAGGEVAFARTVIKFDPAKVQLAGEITTTSVLSTVVQKSTKAQANSAGQAIIVIAASPSDNKPAGSFEFASFALSAKSSQSGSAELSYEVSDMQIVDSTGKALTPQSQNLTVSLNGGAVNNTPVPQPTSPPSNNPTNLPSNPTPTIPQVENPGTACQNKSSMTCLNLWVREYLGIANTKHTDFASDGKIDLNDFESIRRAMFP